METEFKVDQKVVYPSQGVGIVKEIFEKTFKDQNILYYKIYIEASDMMVMIPVSKAQDLGIRQIVSKEEAEEALKLLSDEFEPITSDWKLRYQMNLDLLKKGTVKDIATIVRCLYNRSKVKELPIMERKLYESAKKLLEDEISFALGKTAKEIEAEIHTKLEPFGASLKIKPIAPLDEDDEDDDLMDDINDKPSKSSNDSDDDDDNDDVSDDLDSSNDMDSDEDFDEEF
ncbi:MAG: CarD family transcriptional regulator [Spirochaetia bacterium]|nr:CarD family transcriptional regulator [Spirochaetia bacterium]MDD7611157.1 CarD family transcriptional regulator [Spirochaetales bacterium]MDY5916516.1 CarD family transcriptional regulator [Treponema sp.]